MNSANVDKPDEPARNSARGGAMASPDDGVIRAERVDLELYVGQIYRHLHELAARELDRAPAGQTLQPTALLHEAWLRLSGSGGGHWLDDSDFTRAAVRAMRRVLVEHARARKREKRLPDERRITFSTALEGVHSEAPDVADVHEALERLAEIHPRQAETIEMRFFGGLTNADVARALRVSLRTVEGDWTMARTWLKRELGERG